MRMIRHFLVDSSHDWQSGDEDRRIATRYGCLIKDVDSRKSDRESSRVRASLATEDYGNSSTIPCTGSVVRTSEVRLITNVITLLSSVTLPLSAVQSCICRCTLKVVSLASIKLDHRVIRVKRILPIRKSWLTCCSTRAMIAHLVDTI